MAQTPNFPNLSFDYTRFKAQYDLEKGLRLMCNKLEQHTDGAGRKTFAVPEGREPYFADVLRSLNIVESTPAEPDFVFEFKGKTIEEIEDTCKDKKVSFIDMTQNRGYRVYYNTKFDPEDTSEWEETSRPEAADIAQEASETVFIDERNTVVDWKRTLNNLKRLATDRKYTEKMMKDCLNRLVNRHMKEQTSLLEDKDVNEIARFLLKLDTKIDKLSIYRKRLFTFQREPMEELSAAMARFTNLIDKIYPKTEPENISIRDNLLKTAIISFLPDQIGIPLLDQIKRAADRCEPLSYESILEQAMSIENYEQTVLRVPLTFGRELNSVPVGTQLQFNSMKTEPLKKKRGNEFCEKFGYDYPQYEILSQYMSQNPVQHPVQHLVQHRVQEQVHIDPVVPQPGTNNTASGQSSTLVSPNDTVRQVQSAPKLEPRDDRLIVQENLSPIIDRQERLQFSPSSSSASSTSSTAQSTPMISVDYNQMPMGQSLIPQNDGTFTTLINGVQVPVVNLPNALFSPDPYTRTTAQLNSPDPLVRAAAHIARQQQAEAALRSSTSVPQTTVPTQQYTTVPVQVITNPLPDSPMINLKNLQPTVQLENLQRDQLIRQGLILAEASNRDRIGTRSQTQAQKEQSMPETNSIQFNPLLYGRGVIYPAYFKSCP
jgi:hypothetical protein